MTYISVSSDFALHLEDYLIYMNIILRIIGQYDPMFDLKMNVSLCDLYFMVL